MKEVRRTDCHASIGRVLPSHQGSISQPSDEYASGKEGSQEFELSHEKGKEGCVRVCLWIWHLIPPQNGVRRCVNKWDMLPKCGLSAEYLCTAYKGLSIYHVPRRGWEIDVRLSILFRAKCRLSFADVIYVWSPIARRDGEAVYDHAEQREMAPLPYLLRCVAAAATKINLRRAMWNE